MGPKRRRSCPAAAAADDNAGLQGGVDYFIRPLSAPMYLSRTGELCSSLHISQGSVLSIGRSRKWCDLVFRDSRVSRRHCHIRSLSRRRGLILSHGPAPEKVIDGDAIPESTSFKSSLNGIFVNGHELMGRSITLKCGDEVSLVGPTQAGKCLELDCQLAVGFIIETRSLALSNFVKKRRDDSIHLCTQIGIIGEKISSEKRVSMSSPHLCPKGGLSPCDCNFLQADEPIQNYPVHEHLVKTEMEHFNILDSSIPKFAGKSCCSTRTKEEGKLKLEPLNTVMCDKEHFVMQHLDDANVNFSRKSAGHENIVQCRPIDTSVSLDLENKLRSAFNLVKASIELRTSLLNESKIDPYIDKREPMLLVAENKAYHICKDGMTSHIPFQNNCSSGQLTMVAMNGYDNLTAYASTSSNLEPAELCSKVVQADYENSLKTDLVAEEKCSARENTIDNLYLPKIGKEITCHVSDYDPKCPILQSKEEGLKAYSKSDEGKGMYKTAHEELSIEDHMRTADTEFIDKDIFLEHLVNFQKQCTPEVKRLHSIMSFETASLLFEDEHCLTECRDATSGETALPEKNCKLLLKYCDRAEADQAKNCQSSGSFVHRASFCKASELRYLYDESKQILGSQQCNGSNDNNMLTHIKTGKEISNCLRSKEPSFEVDDLAAAMNITHLIDVQNKGDTSVNETTHKLSGTSYVENMVQVSEKYHSKELKVVIPTTTSVFIQKRCSQTLIDEPQKMVLDRDDGKDSESKSGYALNRKACNNISDTVHGSNGSPYTCCEACPKIIPKVGLDGCVAEAENLKLNQIEEHHHKKKEHYKSRTCIELAQEGRNKQSSFETQEFLVDNNKNSKINYKKKELLEDHLFARNGCPHRCGAACQELNPKVDFHDCVVEFRNLNCTRSKEQYKKKEHDQSGTYTKCTQEREVHDFAIDHYQKLKINSRTKEQIEDKVTRKCSSHIFETECQEIIPKIDLSGCVTEAQYQNCRKSNEQYKKKEHDQSGTYTKCVQEETKMHSSNESLYQTLKIKSQTKAQFEDKLSKERISYTTDACLESNTKMNLHGCVAEAQNLRCSQRGKQHEKNEHDQNGMYTKFTQEDRNKHSSIEVHESLAHGDRYSKIKSQRKGSQYAYDAAYPKSCPIVDLHGYVAEAQTLKSTKSEEQYNKKEDDCSGTYTKCTQEERKTHSSLEMHTSLIDNCPKVEINCQRKEQFEGKKESPYTCDAEISPKVELHGCVAEIQNLKCSRSDEQYKKGEHDQSETYTKCTQNERNGHSSNEKHKSLMEDDQNLKINSQSKEQHNRKDVHVPSYNIDSSGYFLNRLKDVPDSHLNTVSLEELFQPIDDVRALFITTFTYDVEWFLSFSGISNDIPITVTCHNAQCCFSSTFEDRCEKPYADWPNVTLVYPLFPKSSLIGKGQGIGCHHPKVFLQYRTKSIRVIVSSANLSFKQWFQVTNNVWCQDFPRRQIPDFQSLFRQDVSTTTDFASQLASFLANILENAPSEAHWITDLAAFDFSLATGSLVASIPGIHHRMYENAPQFLATLEKDSFSLSQHEVDYSHRNLGIVACTVAGVKYRFCATADQNGLRIRSLAAVLNDISMYNGSTMPVLLKRAKYLKADPNAVSVVVTSQALCSSQDLFLQEDLHNSDINTMESVAVQSDQGFIKLGFLPRDIASWLALLCDKGFFSFAACIWPTEALAVASGQSDAAVKLAVYVFQGPKFSMLSTTVLTNEELTAIGRLLKSLHNSWGMWRLEHVLSRYKWINSHESDFFVGSSSIGTSLDAKFLAAFAAASGQRAESSSCSQDSDPEWGCWTAEHEAMNPSIGIVFPTIDRVKQNLSHYGILCFAESAWIRLKSATLLHDAVPHPPQREGFPMHIKVARRRFQESPTSRPYGWLYCGSHNFSPAAWGRPACRVGDSGNALGSSLQISNYELGIVLVEPPPSPHLANDGHGHDQLGIDRFILPFKMPPPKYADSDRPATRQAINDAYSELRAMQVKEAEAMNSGITAGALVSEDEIPEEAITHQQQDAAVCNSEVEDAKAEQVYVEALWSQIEDEDG